MGIGVLYCIVFYCGVVVGCNDGLVCVGLGVEVGVGGLVDVCCGFGCWFEGRWIDWCGLGCFVDDVCLFWIFFLVVCDLEFCC